MTEAILDEPVFDETTKEYFGEVIRCQERIAQAGFPNPGKLMILCRLYDALLDVDFESLNRHGVKFLEDNDSNRDLLQLIFEMVIFKNIKLFLKITAQLFLKTTGRDWFCVAQLMPI